MFDNLDPSTMLPPAEKREDVDTPADDSEWSCQGNDATSEPPDGGVRAWSQVLCMHLVFFNTWGVANGYGVFQQYYLQELDESPSAISWIGSLQVFLLFFVGVATGRMADTGHFRPVFFVGVFLQVFALFMTSLATKYYQVLLAQAICLGLGNGCSFVPALAILSQYFKRNRAFSVGVAAAGGAVGGLVYPILINRLIFYDNVGFPWTMRIMGFFMLATYVPCLVWLRPRLPPRGTGPWIDSAAFTELPFILFSISWFFSFWGLYFAFFYMGTFARDRIGIAEPIYLLVILNGVGVPGRIVPNLIADRWVGCLNCIAVGTLATSLLVYCWAAVSTGGGLVAFTVLYGILASALQSLYPAGATLMTSDPGRAGTRIGMMMGFVSFANLTGPSICGALIKAQGGEYIGAQMFAASSILLGGVMAIAARVAKTGLVLKAKV